MEPTEGGQTEQEAGGMGEAKEGEVEEEVEEGEEEEVAEITEWADEREEEAYEREEAEEVENEQEQQKSWKVVVGLEEAMTMTSNGKPLWIARVHDKCKAREYAAVPCKEGEEKNKLELALVQCCSVEILYLNKMS